MLIKIIYALAILLNLGVVPYGIFTATYVAKSYGIAQDDSFKVHFLSGTVMVIAFTAGMSAMFAIHLLHSHAR